MKNHHLRQRRIDGWVQAQENRINLQKCFILIAQKRKAKNFAKNTSKIQNQLQCNTGVKVYSTKNFIEKKLQRLVLYLLGCPKDYGNRVLPSSVQESVQNQSKQFEYFVRFPESDGPWFEDPKADAVQHVENEKQVKKLIKKKEPMLLMFYTPWCSACKTVKKEF